jgi:hypothetical protein
MSSKPKPSANSHSATKTGLNKGSPPACADQECEHSPPARAPFDERAHAARGVGAPSIAADRSRREPRQNIGAGRSGRVIRFIANRETTSDNRLDVEAA